MKCKCKYLDGGNLDRLKKDLDLHEAQEDKTFKRKEEKKSLYGLK